MNIKEPTSDQCSSKEKVYEDESQVGYAIWYPQMGGYSGKSIVLLDKNHVENENGSRIGGCFDILVWHDGKFPFCSEEGDYPIELHHCCTDQFIEFGRAVSKLQNRGMEDKNND